jgi:hypothetical protein
VSSSVSVHVGKIAWKLTARHELRPDPKLPEEEEEEEEEEPCTIHTHTHTNTNTHTHVHTYILKKNDSSVFI